MAALMRAETDVGVNQWHILRGIVTGLANRRKQKRKRRASWDSVVAPPLPLKNPGQSASAQCSVGLGLFTKSLTE
jgi:hypothetical protein